MTLYGWIISARGDSARLRLADSVTAVHHGAELLPLGFGGPLIVILGALPPACWAAKARTTTSLPSGKKGRLRTCASGFHYKEWLGPVG